MITSSEFNKVLLSLVFQSECHYNAFVARGSSSFCIAKVDIQALNAKCFCKGSLSADFDFKLIVLICKVERPFQEQPSKLVTVIGNERGLFCTKGAFYFPSGCFSTTQSQNQAFKHTNRAFDTFNFPSKSFISAFFSVYWSC